VYERDAPTSETETIRPVQEACAPIEVSSSTRMDFSIGAARIFHFANATMMTTFIRYHDDCTESPPPPPPPPPASLRSIPPGTARDAEAALEG